MTYKNKKRAAGAVTIRTKYHTAEETDEHKLGVFLYLFVAVKAGKSEK